MFSARVAELVDALDLGSSAPSAWGFNSPLSHQKMIEYIVKRPVRYGKKKNKCSAHMSRQ